MEADSLKETNQKIARERDRYLAIFQSIAEPAYVVDHTMRLIVVNKAFEFFFGVTEDGVKGEKCRDVIKCELCEKCPLLLAMNLRSSFSDVEASMNLKGDEKKLLVSGSFLDVGGRESPDGFVVIQDITCRKQKEEALRKQEYQQKAILNNIPDIAWLKDSESRFIAVNEPFSEACGMKPEELVGKTDMDIWPEPLAIRYRADDREVINSGRRKQVEEPLEDTTGKQTWIETIKTPVYDEEGNIIGTTGIARDITERKKVEEELRMHKYQLEKLVNERTADFETAISFLKEEIEFRKRTEETLRKNEAKMRHLHGMKILGELAVGVAHEVRNPLHALMSVTEALKNELKDNPDFDIYLFHIRKQVERLSILMKDLLDLGKPIEPSHLRAESISEICLASIDLWKNSPSRKRHTVSFVQRPFDKSIVIGDSQRLQQVFLNLLENAANHSPEESDIQVVISGPDENSAENIVRVKVVDRGAGISEDMLPRIFEPFFTTRRGGTGLGLSIIKNILDGHDGRLVVRNNNPLPGCTAEVVLPLAIEAKQ